MLRRHYVFDLCQIQPMFIKCIELYHAYFLYLSINHRMSKFFPFLSFKFAWVQKFTQKYFTDNAETMTIFLRLVVTLTELPYCEKRFWACLVLKKLSWLLISHFHVKILLFTLISTSKSDFYATNNWAFKCMIMNIAACWSFWRTWNGLNFYNY